MKWGARPKNLCCKGLTDISKIVIEFVDTIVLSAIIEFLYKNDSFNLEGLQLFMTFLITDHIFLRLFLLVSDRSL